MKPEQLIGKWAVRLKPIMKIEKDYGGGLMAFDRGFREVPDTKYTTTPAKIVAVKEGVVYIHWQNYGGTITKEILNPIYNDDNWAPVDAEFLGLPQEED